MIVPNLLDDISINTSPRIPSSAVNGILGVNDLSNIELVISHNLLNNCEYNLAWKASYFQNGYKTSYINSQSGSIITTLENSEGLNAPTLIYGDSPNYIVSLDDKTIGNVTSLESPDQKIRTYNFGNYHPYAIGQDEWTDNKIPSTTQIYWTQEAPLRVYQAFYTATKDVKAYSDFLGIDFGVVHVSSCNAENSFSQYGSTQANAFITIGRKNGHCLAEFDIVGHELAHSYLHNFINSDKIGIATLHEAISDMFGTYIESKTSPAGLDWVMGDDDPATFQRDLQNPPTNQDCFNEVINEGKYERGLPLSHWFYLISAGNQNTPALGIQKAIDIVMTALPSLTDESDVEDLKNITVANVLKDFGRCSNEFVSVANAWETICFTTGYAVSGVVYPCSYTVQGPNSICEEDDEFELCVPDGVLTEDYSWYIDGSNSTDFKSDIGMTGNHQLTGKCLSINDIPSFNYYPQYFTITVFPHSLSPQYAQTFHLTILDCNHDKPTCEEYYNLNHKPLKVDDYVDSELNFEYDKVKVFDFLGRLLYEGDNYDYLNNLHLKNELGIAMFLNKKGEIIKVKKILLFK